MNFARICTTTHRICACRHAPMELTLCKLYTFNFIENKIKYLKIYSYHEKRCVHFWSVVKVVLKFRCLAWNSNFELTLLFHSSLRLTVKWPPTKHPKCKTSFQTQLHRIKSVARVSNKTISFFMEHTDYSWNIKWQTCACVSMVSYLKPLRPIPEHFCHLIFHL